MIRRQSTRLGRRWLIVVTLLVRGRCCTNLYRRLPILRMTVSPEQWHALGQTVATYLTQAVRHRVRADAHAGVSWCFPLCPSTGRDRRARRDTFARRTTLTRHDAASKHVPRPRSGAERPARQWAVHVARPRLGNTPARRLANSADRAASTTRGDVNRDYEFRRTNSAGTRSITSSNAVSEPVVPRKRVRDGGGGPKGAGARSLAEKCSRRDFSSLMGG